MRDSTHRQKLLWTLALTLALGACSATEEDCAKGTKLSGGVCVADGPANAGKPLVSSLWVKYLDIAEEGKRPLYLMHPMTVKIGLEVKAKPFKSDLVVGLSSADGSKHCAAGYVELVFNGGADAGADPGSGAEGSDSANPTASDQGELTLEKTLFVQPRCKNLIGEKKAKVWIAIDPFRRLAFEADQRLASAPEPTGIDQIDAFLHASRWPLDQCKSSQSSGHPDNCNAVMKVEDTPGLDVRMRGVQASSSVLTLQQDKFMLNAAKTDIGVAFAPTRGATTT